MSRYRKPTQRPTPKIRFPLKMARPTTQEQTTMKFVPVVSSQIAQLGHDADTSTMRVVFTNGSTYEYANVSRELFEELLAAPSVGSHFSKVIKKNPGLYPFTKVGA